MVSEDQGQKEEHKAGKTPNWKRKVMSFLQRV